MARHLYAPVGKCIYCGETKLPADIDRLGNEHIIPLALGGNLILPEASCKSCEKIINREIETPVSSHEWGKFRAKRKFPSRDKRRQKKLTHIDVRSVDGTPMQIPLSRHSTPVVMYKFHEARILSGAKRGDDNHHWLPILLASHDEEMAMKRDFPNWDQRHIFKAQPYQFARLLAKIGHGYVTAEMGIDTFIPLGIDIILGRSDDYFHTVGGSWDIAPAVPCGDHITKINIQFVASDRALIVVDIRLLSATTTPSYRVVAGEIDLNNPEHCTAFEKHRLDGKIEEILFSPA